MSTGGGERTTWDDVFTSTRVRNRQVRDLVMPLTLMLLVPARGRDRRAAAAAFRGRARLAGNDEVPTASAGTATAAGSLTGSAECAACWDTTGGATQARHVPIGARQGQGAQPDGALSERTIARVAGALSPNSVPTSRRPPHSAFRAPARPDLEATDSRGRAAQPGTWRSSAVGGRIVRRAS